MTGVGEVPCGGAEGLVKSFGGLPGGGASHFRAGARHTFSGVIGISMWSTPRASQTAFTYACDDAIVPVSPTPFTPSGLCGDGVTVEAVSIRGASRAVGTRYSMRLFVRRFPFSS